MVASNKGGNMSKEIAIQNDMGLMGTSDAFFKSGYFPDVKSAAQAAIKIMAGQEIGVGPFASMRGIVVNHGKLELSAGLVGSLIKQSGVYDYRIVTHTNEQCVLTFYEQGNDVGKSGFTIADAQKAGLTAGSNAHSWAHYPRNMLFSRALTNGARWYCPDIFSGSIYTPDEMGTPIDGETGEVVEAEVVEEPHGTFVLSTEPMPRPREIVDGGWAGVDPDMPEAPIIYALPSIEARPWSAEDTRRVLEAKIAEKRDALFSYTDDDERGKRLSALIVQIEGAFALDFRHPKV